MLLALIHSGMAMGMLTCVYVHPPTPPTPPCTAIVLVRRDFRQRLSCIIEEAVLRQDLCRVLCSEHHVPLQLSWIKAAKK